MKKSLELLRKEIDRADSALLTILAKRVLRSKKIGALKKKSGAKSVVDAKRKKQMIAARIALGKKKGLSPRLIREVFEVIHKDSVKIQRRQK
jgi:chorismate mutase